MLCGKVKILVLFYVFLLCVGIFADVNEENCPNATCKTVVDCPTAVAELKRRRPHGLTRCGFVGFSEVVCCPDFPNTEKSTETDNGNHVVWEKFGPSTEPRSVEESEQRKSAKACQNYIDQDPPSVDFHILDGELAGLGEFPHMVVIGYNDDENIGSIKWDCGGSLISNSFVLTAAHCVVLLDGSSPVLVRTGFVNFDDPKVSPQEFTIKNISAHDDYSRLNKIHDIALLELNGTVRLTSSASPACLHQINDNPPEVVISGWGFQTVGGNKSRTLQKATITSIDQAECDIPYRKVLKEITESHICAVSRNDSKDTCQGDSGGPLQVKISNKSEVYSIVGVTAYGMGCGGSIPAVYTRVFFYLDWIESIVWP